MKTKKITFVCMKLILLLLALGIPAIAVAYDDHYYDSHHHYYDHHDYHHYPRHFSGLNHVYFNNYPQPRIQYSPNYYAPPPVPVVAYPAVSFSISTGNAGFMFGY